MIKTLRAALGSGNEKALARFTFAAVTTLVLLAMVFAGPSAGAGAAIVLAQGSPSPTSTGTGKEPTIKLLNPDASYDPGFSLPPREPGTPDTPKISDKFDGVDSAYHVVAWTSNTPANAVVEAYWEPDVGFEVTVGTLLPIAGQPNFWETHWEIPDSLPEGTGEFHIELFDDTGAGIESVASDTEPAELRHVGGPTDDPLPAEETVELTWPTQNGPLGFFKGGTGPWRTVIDGSASNATQRVNIYYSVADPGAEPQFKRCTQNARLGAARADGSRAITGTNAGAPPGATCVLGTGDIPEDVVAIAAVAIEDDKAQGATTAEFTADSADVHLVQGYVQDPSTMTVTVAGNQYFSTTASTPTGQRREQDVDCLEYIAMVTDELGRPVQGANLDAHLVGPTDQVGFGDEGDVVEGSSGYRPPDKAHGTESGRDCDTALFGAEDTRGDPFAEQGETNVPGGPDEKHRETTGGSGIPESTDEVLLPGAWRFHDFSEDAGRTEIEVWVDDSRFKSDLTKEPDNDVLDDGEPVGTSFSQWLPGPLKLTFEPAGGGAAVGSCQRYILRARAGDAVVDGINVDIHGQGPGADLDFCDPGDATGGRAPDKGDHQAEDSLEATNPGTPPIQHTEGETNDAGNFIFGITSPGSGDSTLTAWVDGEPGANNENDIQETAEVNATLNHTWGVSLDQARIRFVNPSGYAGGAGDNISVKRDVDTQYHLVARTDAFEALPGVEFLLSSNDGESFTKIGDGTRIGETDSYEFFWNVGVQNGDYILRAQILGTNKFEDREVTINSAMETAEITTPIDGTTAAFTQDGLKVTGFASADTERLRLFYTRSAAGDVRESSTWTQCAQVTLQSSGSDPRRFETQCRLADGDSATGVTGIAAIAIDCHAQLGCQDEAASQTQIPESGDAHRVFGIAADPILSLEPAESESRVKTCQRLVLTVQDQTGQALTDTNVDVHLSGPGDDVSFCDVEEQSSRTPPDQGGHTGDETDEALHEDESGPDTHHTEGSTGGQGRFVFGIRSDVVGDSTLIVWVDMNDDDVAGSDERSDVAVMHWVNPVKKKQNQGGCTKEGTPGDDILRGTRGDDKICGRGGDDVLRGGPGNDVLIGGKGNDRVIGGAGNDKHRAGTGRDRVNGAKGRDRLNGGGGPDRLNGGAGRDSCDGGRGRDKFTKCEKRRR